MKPNDSTSCDHHAWTPATKAEMKAAFAAAQQRAETAGLRWTNQRARALEMLMQAHGPVKAYDLIAEFQPGGRTTPPTVYRALDALVELGLAHKISSMNAYVACTRHAHPHHAASFLFCDCCGSVEEFEAPVGEVVNAIKAQSAFHLNEMTLEVHGLCAPCQAGHPTGR